MTELADAVLLSRSGVTRLVDRLERIGLVARAKVADDGRGVTARLTDTGYERLRTAAVTHLRGVGRTSWSGSTRRTSPRSSASWAA